MKHMYQPEGAHCPHTLARVASHPTHRYSLTGFCFVGASCLEGVAVSPKKTAHPAHRSRHTAAPPIHPSRSSSNSIVNKCRKFYMPKKCRTDFSGGGKKTPRINQEYADHTKYHTAVQQYQIKITCILHCTSGVICFYHTHHIRNNIHQQQI